MKRRVLIALQLGLLVWLLRPVVLVAQQPTAAAPTERTPAPDNLQMTPEELAALGLDSQAPALDLDLKLSGFADVGFGTLPPGSSARSRFDRALLGLAPDRVGAYWIDQRVRFGKTPPRVIPSPELVMRVVASLKGAIGYVEMDPSSVPSALTVLGVEGKAPTDPGYIFAVDSVSND